MKPAKVHWKSHFPFPDSECTLWWRKWGKRPFHVGQTFIMPPHGKFTMRKVKIFYFCEGGNGLKRTSTTLSITNRRPRAQKQFPLCSLARPQFFTSSRGKCDEFSDGVKKNLFRLKSFHPLLTPCANFELFTLCSLAYCGLKLYHTTYTRPCITKVITLHSNSCNIWLLICFSRVRFRLNKL